MPVTNETLNTWLYECGHTCPRCGLAIGNGQQTKGPEIIDDTIYVDYSCPRCDLEWSNAYRLSNPMILNDDYDEDLFYGWVEKNGVPGMRWESGEWEESDA